ncbi:MAG: glycoside hydrolase family 3 C-terminal domain-containing protein [Dorea sp.]|nr:glycoside hydrolase family 3 C-terminal domain-containing protein [Dorea sp.]MDY2814282.1 glycoside hydrolase family 3 C-terminal domain-containing protein [Dorea sp.]
MTREQARAKAHELVGKMTLEEKASQLKFDAPAIERLGIPAYNWWNEALHGVARAGTATVFPQAIAMAAMFDDDKMKEIADVIATEGRAKYNEYSKQEDRDIYKGLTFWSPNVNIFRDPRWGRGHETYGEDPYLTSRLGVKFVEGLQGDGEVMKAAACAKHFAVHSGPEALRHEFDAVASKKDMYETYLPAFEALVKEAKVESVMGAYNRTNGEPCCGSQTLLVDILRKQWGFEGHVVSDCWAVRDFHENHKVTGRPEESVAMALKAGCDCNCGCTYEFVVASAKEGLISEEDITTSCERLFTTRYLLGLFDGSEFDEIPYEVVECKEHVELAVDVARKSAVLLKNDGVLPLQKEKLKTIGVVGPNANSRVPLFGNYYGTSSRYITILEGIQDEVGEDVRVLYSEGCHLYKDRVEGLAWEDDRISEAVTVANHSDVTVVVVGLDETLEGEELDQSNGVGSGDKADLLLPEPQRRLLKAVADTGKPFVVILMAGSSIDLSFAEEHAAAVLQAWYPGARGGKAIADLLFGNCSPSGKLPVTFYKDTDHMPEFTDYSMKGRTYRYMEDEALYPFGYGLTYGKAEVTEAVLKNTPAKESDIEVAVTVKNESNVDIEEVIQLYIKDLDSPLAVKNYSLCGFKRIALKAGEARTIDMTVDNRAMMVVDENGERSVEGRNFTLYAGISQPDDVSVRLTGTTPAVIPFSI